MQGKIYLNLWEVAKSQIYSTLLSSHGRQSRNKTNEQK